jgi:hypothetical protein
VSVDAWTVTVLAVVLVALVRPAIASLLQRYGARSARYKYNPERTGGGAAMLMLAGYLVSGPSRAVGRGYWDLATTALTDPFIRSLPEVWVPVLCWLVLVVLGCLWLFSGLRGYRGPRKSATLVWALNEFVIWTAVLLWGVYVPGDWSQAVLINFALEGLYLSFMVGAGLRFILVMLNPGGPSLPLDPGLEARSNAWFGRFRRY